MPTDVIKPEHFRRDDRRETYARLRSLVGTEAVYRRIPAGRYSAIGFAERHVAGYTILDVAHSAAEELASRLPCPIFFTHRRVPVFRDAEQRGDALALTEELLHVRGCLEATWMRPGWGLEPEDDDGGDHLMAAVLRVVDRLDWDWPGVADCEPWQRARRFFKAVRFAEQVVGASVACRVRIAEQVAAICI